MATKKLSLSNLPTIKMLHVFDNKFHMVISLFLPLFIFPQGGKVVELLNPWGKVGKGFECAQYLNQYLIY
jgi:hypothetical protein